MKIKPFTLASLFISLGFAAAAADSETNFVPSNPPEMKPLTHHTPAYNAAKMFMHGVNLGDYLEAGRRGVTVSADEFTQMKREGFDHVRVPVGWQHHVGPAPDFTVSPEFFSRVDFVVTNALKNELAVMVNIHHFDELDENPANAADEFLAIWRQIAVHYKNFPKSLAFELDNEPHKNATTVLMNPIYARAIAEIRKTNPQRTIFVEPGSWGNVNELKNLVLPPDDNVIVSVHCYYPFYFTHQGATWTEKDTRATGIKFPGPPVTPFTPDPALKLSQPVLDWIQDYNTLPAEKNPGGPIAFEGRMKLAREWSDYYGRPIHFGEFGAYIKADQESRAHFYAAFRRALDKQKIGWAIWDWSSGFRYWDKKGNQPLPGMHEALFGELN